MNYEVINNFEPKTLWKFFSDLTELPRPSRKEQQVINYLEQFAKSNGLDYKIDDVGNVYIFKKGTRNIEADEPLIIQNHIDMVTDHRTDPTFDFSVNPIQIKLDEDGTHVCAVDTTLGADNGIGVATALALLASDDIAHPPLECLFTVDEETGLNGAINIRPEFLSGKKLLNLDTEEWGSFYIGCAGGANIDFIKKYQLLREKKPFVYSLNLEGLSGGHSGIEIHKQRGNAILLLTQFLIGLLKKGHQFNLCMVEAGRAHNIIPNRATMTITSGNDLEKDIVAEFEAFKSSIADILPPEDQSISLKLASTTSSPGYLNDKDTLEVLRFASLLPHGVNGYDINTNYEVVSSSLNVAKLVLNEEGYIGLLCSLRFFNQIEREMLLSKLESLSDTFQFNMEISSGYPSWKPNSNSNILKNAKEVYLKMFGENPLVTAIHAGLECGILLEKIGEIETLSIGPNIYGAHTVDERVEIKSVETYWNYLIELLKVI